ncbi:Vegetative incompatibility protein HET-E-1 [Pseudocercospora fuligena]|uniref:Vegetative incompatibility protein HET-E-1 n=1 Tax=Pseudocercospora fuligena TaxID=685502 RepID=A0A8H6VK84_9PEZI|nr:Vegetative incompatibility protein HET-E-1 [Pseudocercospora fuligena]
MRLIDIETLELHDFENPPPYAILSHRWTDNEISFQSFTTSGKRQGPGFNKIRDFCAFLKLYPHLTERVEWNQTTKTRETIKVRWAWVDTCCIDKHNSAELSETINSMWSYYQNAKFCVAYLSDVPETEDFEASFIASEWFKRGWTLQELLAPAEVWFCNANWNILGSKRLVSLWMARDFLRILSKASKIPVYYLDDPTRQKHQMASIAQKMSWASMRKTTRPEDIAYCLLGLFNITMPLVYGEGNNAFRRLQQEILRHSNDESIFAWRPSLDDDGNTTETGILAPSPEFFAQAQHMHRCNLIPRQPYRVTNKGIKMQAPLIKVSRDLFLLQINCVEIPGVDGPVSDPQYLHSGIMHGAHGCMVPLKKDVNGIFLRANIDGQEEEENEEAKEVPLDENTLLKESTIYIHAHTPPAIRTDPDYIASRVNVVAHDCLSSQPLAVIWYDKSAADQEGTCEEGNCGEDEGQQDSLVSEDPSGPSLPRGLVLPRAPTSTNSEMTTGMLKKRISCQSTASSAGIPSAARRLIQQAYLPSHIGRPPRFVDGSDRRPESGLLSTSNEASNLTSTTAEAGGEITPHSATGLAISFSK